MEILFENENFRAWNNIKNDKIFINIISIQKIWNLKLNPFSIEDYIDKMRKTSSLPSMVILKNETINEEEKK